VRELHTRFEPEKEQELREQKGSAVEKLEEIYGEEIQEEARNEQIENADVASSEKVDTTEIITNGTETCDQQNQDIKHEDLLEQHLGKFFSNREEHYCNAEHVFDIKLKRNLEDGVLFQWWGRLCFDPGKKPILLDETFSNLMSKKIEYMELKMLQLASENAENKAQEVFVMSKSEKASIVVLAVWKNNLVCGLSGNGSGSAEEKDSMGFWFGDVRKNFVVFKHRWRWKFSCWRPPRVPRTGAESIAEWARHGVHHLLRHQHQYELSPNLHNQTLLEEELSLEGHYCLKILLHKLLLQCPW
jgi:hypothetical protein